VGLIREFASGRWGFAPVGFRVREKIADRLHEELGRDDVLLFDDHDRSVGERFAESDLVGRPAKVVVGNGYRETGSVDPKTRDRATRHLAPEAVDAFAAGNADR
jgi:prolyl-tRNA synthetase